MSQHTAGFIMGGVGGVLVGFLIAYWLIIAYANGWWRNS